MRPKTYAVVDLFDCSAGDLARLRSGGCRPVAYFSSQYEKWRPDAARFSPADLGQPLDGWPDERWVDTKSATVRAIIRSRLDLAKRRGFYAVDVDNTDFYNFKTGFDNSRSAAVDYVRFIAREAHARGLKYSLKNSTEIISKVRRVVDFYQNEECQQYDECDAYAGVGPVFNIEYQRPSRPFKRAGFYSLLKRERMDGWEEEL